MEHRGIEASKHRSKEASKRRSLHEASKHWRIEVSKYRSIGSSSRGRRNSGVARYPHLAGVLNTGSNSAQSPEEVYLLPPPPLAAAIPPTRSMDCPRTAHGLPTVLPEIAFGSILALSWSSSGALVRRLGRLMWLLELSWDLPMPLLAPSCTLTSQLGVNIGLNLPPKLIFPSIAVLPNLQNHQFS